MSNGLWNFFKKIHNRRKEERDETSENYVNTNPTEEQLKDNKNGNMAIVFSVIACILLDVIIGIIVLAFTSNVAIGLFSIFLLFIPSWLQNLAVKKAKKQLNINGKGRIKLILVKYIFPIIAVIIAAAILLFWWAI